MTKKEEVDVIIVSEQQNNREDNGWFNNSNGKAAIVFIGSNGKTKGYRQKRPHCRRILVGDPKGN